MREASLMTWQLVTSWPPVIDTAEPNSLPPSARVTTTFNTRALNASPSGAAAWLGANAAPISNRDRSNATAGDLDINVIRIQDEFNYLRKIERMRALPRPTNRSIAHPRQVPARVRVL
jgi:hypothetical protein